MIMAVPIRGRRPLVAAILLLLASLQARPASAADEAPARDRSDAQPHRSFGIRLDVRQIPQERLLCVPTAAAMIMKYYGDDQAPRKLKTLSRGKTYRAADRFDDFSITLYRDIVTAAATLGYAWSEQTFADTATGFQHGLATIRTEIEQGRPVMVDVSAPDGHTFVVAGLDEPNRSLLVTDPNVPAPGRYAIPYERFEAIWNEHAFGKRFRSLVITAPRRRADERPAVIRPISDLRTPPPPAPSSSPPRP